MMAERDDSDTTDQMRLHASDAAGLMKALGNESRLMILCSLAGGEHSVSELNEIVPLSQSALSQQLARLRQQGLDRDHALEGPARLAHRLQPRGRRAGSDPSSPLQSPAVGRSRCLAGLGPAGRSPV